MTDAEWNAKVEAVRAKAKEEGERYARETQCALENDDHSRQWMSVAWNAIIAEFQLRKSEAKAIFPSALTIMIAASGLEAYAEQCRRAGVKA